MSEPSMELHEPAGEIVPENPAATELLALTQALRGFCLAQLETRVPWVTAQGSLGLPQAPTPPSAARTRAANHPAPSRPADQPAVRQLTLPDLEREVAACARCGLAATRRRACFGVGPTRPRVVFLDQYPTREEELDGKPFPGAVGELFDAILERAMGLPRSQVYVTHVLKCCLPEGAPAPLEASGCLAILEEQLALLQPEVLVVLGELAAQAVLVTAAPLEELRGRWHTFAAIPVRVTHHPEQLVRYPELKAAAWEDIKEVMARLGLKRPKR